jgi:hypothetical protein
MLVCPIAATLPTKGPALDGREGARDQHGAMLDDRKRQPGTRTEPVGKKIERNIAAARRYQDEPEHHQPDHHEHQHFVGAGEHDPEQVAANGVDHV